MMNSRGQFEDELRQLVELTTSSKKSTASNESDSTVDVGQNLTDLSVRVKYYSAQESFMSNDIPSAFRHLILNYTSRLGATLQAHSGHSSARSPIPHALEHLESLVSNDLKLSLVTADPNIAKSLHNDFFLNLVIDAQSLVEWLASKSSSSDGDEFAGDHNDENLLAGRVDACFLLNNLGILNFGLKKYALCSLFAKKALYESRRLLTTAEADGKTTAAVEKSDESTESNSNNNNAGSFAINKPHLGNTALFKVKKSKFWDYHKNL